MSDQKSGLQANQQQASGGYTPAPVKKTRAVTGTQPKVTSSGPVAIHDGIETEISSVSRESRPSIQINLNTINEATQSVVDQELEERAKLAEFAPLSSTPVAYQAPSADHFSDQWANQMYIPDALTPPPQGAYSAQKNPDLYKGRRRSLRIIAALFLCSAWFIAMAIQVGIPRLLADPYGETIALISGKGSTHQEKEKVVVPTVQTTININEGQAVARVLSVDFLDKGVLAVQGVVLNETSHSLDTVLMQLTLRSPEGSSEPWVERFELACCKYQELEGLDKAKIAEIIERASEDSSLDSHFSLNEGGSAKFTYIAQLKGERSRLKRGVMPIADLEVSFFE